MWHVLKKHQNGCSSYPDYVNIVPTTCSYFGKYSANCDEQFSCTSSGDATTQLWLIHGI